MHGLKELLQQEVVDVSTEVSHNDIMWKGTHDVVHYFRVGQLAVQSIRIAMLLADKEDVESILILPCGHGRELRTINAAFSNATITACDIDQDGVDFCARAFDAIPVYSKEQPHQIQISSNFDLIWCGSLLTHLNSDRWAAFLTFFESLLIPGGILIFTTHGRYVAERLRGNHFAYGLSQSVIQDVLEDYDRSGFGYGDYSHRTDYGISVSAPSWGCLQVEKVPNLRLLNYTEQGWDKHQDVIACVKV
jgi:SAM-dependent methyltransferase